jgi:acyl-CoA:acyl-CoA alkyltransferase
MKFSKVIIESLTRVLPPQRLTSEDIETELADVYTRLRLPTGRLELMTGIRARHFWPTPIAPSAASSEAGKKLLAQSVFGKNDFDLLIHAAVCRDCLEPATASFVHESLAMGPRTQILDVSNACLGFANAMVLAAGLIESGQIRRALIVAGEDGRPLLERTLQRLKQPDITRQSIKPYFANLTIGAGAAAMSLCREDDPELGTKPRPRLLAATVQTDSSFNKLCRGDRSTGNAVGLDMLTDSEALLEAGLDVAGRCWKDFLEETAWTAQTPQRVITHQVGRAHQQRLFERLSLDPALDFPTFPETGNIGSVALPGALAAADEANALRPGMPVALLGIGSGLSSLMLALRWE